MKKQGKKIHQQGPARSAPKSPVRDAMKKLEEENLRLKRMLAAQQGKVPKMEQGGTVSNSAQGHGQKRKPAVDSAQPAKRPLPGLPHPAEKTSKKQRKMEGKGQAQVQKQSNFMKLIREQGLDTVSQPSGGDGQVTQSKTAVQLALEEDLREIEELKGKLGGNWRAELEEDGWLDLFDSMDNLGEDSGEEDVDDSKAPRPKENKKKNKDVAKKRGTKKPGHASGKRVA